MRIENEPSTFLKYRADIDGLRAIAVISVVGFHAFPEYIKGGFAGVDIFFVISGFLISGIISQGLERGDFSYIDFYARRIRRIFPALLLVLSASLAFGWLVLLNDEFGQLGKHVLAGAGFVSNFVLWNESGYFDNTAQTKPLLHLWSLGIEEQFYIVWPFLLVLAWERKRNFLILTTYIALVSFAWNINSILHDPTAAFYSPLCHFWELMLGAMLAYLTQHKQQYLLRKSQWPSTAGLVLIVLSILFLDKERSFPGWWALAPDLGSLLLISAGSGAWVNRKLLSSPVLVKIGLISYPLYLWHWPLLSFAQIMESRVPSAGLRVFLVLISLMLASATYKMAEKPIRLGEGNRVKAFFLCLCMMGIGYLGYSVFERAADSNIVPNSIAWYHSKENNTNSQDPNTPALNKYTEILKTQPDYLSKVHEDRLKAVRNNLCNLRDNPFDQHQFENNGCVTLSADKKNILIIGDSHAADLYVALSNTHKQFNFLQLTAVSCTPISHSYYNAEECKKLLEYAENFAEKNKLDAVILAAWWENGYANLTFDIDRLKAKGRKVVLVGPPLQYSADVPKIIARRRSDAGFQRYMDSFITKRSIATSRSMRNFAQSEGISFIDRIHYFCLDGCPVVNFDGQLLIKDYGHLSVNGAIYLGNRLLKENVLQNILGSTHPMQLPEIPTNF